MQKKKMSNTWNLMVFFFINLGYWEITVAINDFCLHVKGDLETKDH